jgi:hypothetical protein
MLLTNITNKLFNEHSRKRIIISALTVSMAITSLNLFANEEIRIKPKKIHQSKNGQEIVYMNYTIDSMFTLSKIKVSDQKGNINQSVIAIQINRPIPNLYNNIREAGILFSYGKGKKFDDTLKFGYLTNKTKKWQILQKDGEGREFFYRLGSAVAQKYIPPVAIIDNLFSKLNKFFEINDRRRGDNIYSKKIKKGHKMYFPVDVVREDRNFPGIGEENVQGIFFKANGDVFSNSSIYVQFRVGIYSSFTGSREYGFELLKGEEEASLSWRQLGRVFDPKGKNLVTKVVEKIKSKKSFSPKWFKKIPNGIKIDVSKIDKGARYSRGGIQINDILYGKEVRTVFGPSLKVDKENDFLSQLSVSGDNYIIRKDTNLDFLIVETFQNDKAIIDIFIDETWQMLSKQVHVCYGKNFERYHEFDFGKSHQIMDGIYHNRIEDDIGRFYLNTNPLMGDGGVLLGVLSKDDCHNRKKDMKHQLFIKFY